MKAARKKRIETHPDRFSGRNISPAEVDEIIEKSKTVGHAADILCDPVTRVQYDDEVAAWRQRQHEADQRMPEDACHASDFGVPDGMSYFGSSSVYNAFSKSREEPSDWE